MNQKLSWDQIKQTYRDEWVELVDFDWDETDPYPSSGVVNAHHKDKKELRKILRDKERPTEAALLFTGEKLIPQHGIFSANLHQYVKQG